MVCLFFLSRMFIVCIFCCNFFLYSDYCLGIGSLCVIRFLNKLVFFNFYWWWGWCRWILMEKLFLYLWIWKFLSGWRKLGVFLKFLRCLLVVSFIILWGFWMIFFFIFGLLSCCCCLLKFFVWCRLLVVMMWGIVFSRKWFNLYYLLYVLNGSYGIKENLIE